MMLRLCSSALVLAALVGSVSASSGSTTHHLTVVNAHIAPDGFSRPWVLPPLPSDTLSNLVAPFTVLPLLPVLFLAQ